MSSSAQLATLPDPGRCSNGLKLGRSAGRYALVEMLGRGAMGVVYRGFDPVLNRCVALKAQHVHDERSRHRFIKEARAMARLSHPNVVQVYDVLQIKGRQGRRPCVLAMELVEGVTLAQWLRTPRSWSEVRDVFVEAGRGLAAAHAAGLVHRDFKPSNVIVGRDGHARVTDFGLTVTAQERAPTVDEGLPSVPSSEAEVELTTRGTVVGTPAYMSPEQHRGVPLGAATDQFSFCAALFEALFTLRPYDGRSSRRLSEQKHLGERRPARGPRPVPGWLARLVVRGLSVDPGDRWAGMDALVEALARPRRRHRWRSAAAALTLLIGGAGLGVAFAPAQSAAGASSAAATSRTVSASATSAASSPCSSSSASWRKNTNSVTTPTSNRTSATLNVGHEPPHG